MEKESENEASLRMLLKSVELDDNDHLAFYHLALQYMHVGLLNEAMVSSSPLLFFLASIKVKDRFLISHSNGTSLKV